MTQIEGDTAVSRFYKGIEVREYWDHNREQSEIAIEMLHLIAPHRTTRGQKKYLLKKLRERRDLLNEMILAGEQELQTKPLTGRESSVLARLAQSLSTLGSEEKLCILKTLDGRALEIAQALVGDTKQPPKDIERAAAGFRTWAERLQRVETKRMQRGVKKP
jgi:hypothetical protein